MTRPRSGSDVPRTATWLGVMLYSVAAAAGFAVFAEWTHYREGLDWRHLRLWDEVVVLWTLAAKSLWLLTPALLLVTVLTWRRKSRAAWAVAIATGALVFAWLAIDLRVNAATQNHANDYLIFLTEPTPWQWGGGTGELLRPLLVLATVVGLAQAVVAWVFHRLAHHLISRRPWLRGRVGLGLVGTAYLTTLLGVIPVARLISQPRTLQELSAAMPVSLPLVPKGGAESTKLDWALQRFSLEAEAVYRRYFQRIMSAHPPDDVQRLPNVSRPHVILIVVESLRHDAVDPRWMPRLDAWARQALRLERHYANANISHLGLFALLYGRHPLLYEITLNARVPPQLPHIPGDGPRPTAPRRDHHR